MSRHKGMTLPEVLIALALLGMITVAVMTLFLGLLASSNKTTDQTAGDLFAQKHLQALVDRGLTRSAPPITAPIQGTYTAQTHDRAKTEFLYKVTAAEVYDPEDPESVGSYWLKLDVIWWDDDGEGRAGMGKTRTSLSRLVHAVP